MPQLDNVTTEQLLQVAAQLRQAQRVLVITGAGISADSGLPTYRGIGGLYDDKQTEEGIPIETALSGHMLATRPELTWKYLLQIEQACRGAGYNRAHEVIAALQQRAKVCVLTQNIDGFHRDAGSEDLIEIHGNVHELFCGQCGYEEWVNDYAHISGIPSCPQCQAAIRPRVVLFGEMLPSNGIQRMQAAMAEGFDMVFSIGTTSAFPYISGPVLEAKRWGATVVEINPDVTEVSDYVHHKVNAGAADSLNFLWQQLN